MNDKYVQKLHIKTAYTNVPLYQIPVNLDNIRFWDQICPTLNESQNFGNEILKS